MGWTVYNSDGQILQGSSTLADDAVTTAKILDDAVTYAKLQNLATADRVLGSASTGVIGEVQIVPDMIATDAVTTVKILDANVTLAKVASQAANTVLVRDASSSGVVSAKAVTNTQILIGDGTGFTAAALSGDVTMANDGAVTIAATAVENSMLADDAVDSDELAAGAVDLAHMSSQSVDEDNLYISNAGSNGEFLSKQSGNNGGLTWATAGGIASLAADTTPQVGGSAGLDLQAQLLVGNGGTTGIAISANGEVTMAAQPCVLAYNPSKVSNISGNGTSYTVTFATEVYDQNADFDGTSTFTAPITGRYLVNISVNVGGITSAGTDGILRLSTSNRTYLGVLNMHAVARGASATFRISFLTDMDSSDTFVVTYTGSEESSDVQDMEGSANMETSVGVYLMA